MKIEIAAGLRCVLLNEPWEKIESFIIVDASDSGASLCKMSEYLSDHHVVQKIATVDLDQIFVSPYQLNLTISDQRFFVEALLVDDLTGALVGTQPGITIEKLFVQLKADQRLQGGDRFLEGCLRSKIAAGDFSVGFDGRRTNRVYGLKLSDARLQKERNRAFAANFAHELQALSERVRNLIHHSGTVGTYRENLLQSVLRKHLPERYHVATGFIHGCRRQIDVLIYDRIDYAPLFREGDLVVVPSESVRAVIEVKTSLSREELRKSLNLMDEVGMVDDLSPPFFRGIFAFQSEVLKNGLFDEIQQCYVGDPDASLGGEVMLPLIINEPFRHLSAMCVLGHSYAQVTFDFDKASKRYFPVLAEATSAAGHKAQAAYFLQHLLAYLNYGGLKAAGTSHVAHFLGADTRLVPYIRLAGEAGWGAYFARDEMGIDEGDKEVEALEASIEAVMTWLEGTAWKPAKS